MTICYFGSYSHADPRNLVLMQGLREQGVTVIECHDDSPGLKKYVRLFLKHWKIRNQYDAIVVGFLGHIIVLFASFLNWPFISFRRRKPIIFDAFMSLYDSNVFGREIVSPKSAKALYYWLVDWISMQCGDVVLFDTKEHIKYVVQEFGISQKRLARIYVGAIESIFHPMPAEHHGGTTRVVFYGTFIKSQGIEYILEAAKMLEAHTNITFEIIGDGQVRKEMYALADRLHIHNVTFFGFMPHRGIADHIASADICLGIFGKASKIQRVIPNKVFEYVAMEKAIITADTPGIRELFSDRDLRLIPVADARAMADAILHLHNDPNLRNQYATNSYTQYRQHASTKQLGAELAGIIAGFIS